MFFLTLSAEDVHAACADAGARDVGGTQVRRLLAQAELSARHSDHGNAVLIYAAAILHQTLNYPPVQQRYPAVGWACSMLAIQRNGIATKEMFDPSERLGALVADHARQRLALPTVVTLIAEAVYRPR